MSLKASGNTPWSVRQLYFACDEGRPRLYDQGLAGFVLGTDDPSVGYVSIVWLPREQAAALERAALDNARALRLLAADYSANAYPFSLRYQNCNQWVIEMLAAAWGGLDDSDALRARAQAWLSGQHYEPQAIDVGSHLLMFAGLLRALDPLRRPSRGRPLSRCAFAPACRRRSRPSCARTCRVRGASSCATTSNVW